MQIPITKILHYFKETRMNNLFTRYTFRNDVVSLPLKSLYILYKMTLVENFQFRDMRIFSNMEV